MRQPQAGLGVHVDHHGHPFSEVRADGGWTLAASHALLEMLADPSGTRFKEGPAIEPGAAPRRVRYLVEICDPCERHDYTIDGVLVSDFVTPDYYRSEATAGTAFDFLRRLGRPLQVSRGGYLSWLDPADGRWHQRRPDGRFVTSGGRIHPDGGSPRDDRDRAFGDTDERHDLSAIRGAPA